MKKFLLGAGALAIGKSNHSLETGGIVAVSVLRRPESVEIRMQLAKENQTRDKLL